MSSQFLLALVILAVFLVVVILFFLKRGVRRQDILASETYTIERLCDLCKVELARLSKDDNFIGRTDEEWEALYNRKILIQKALKNCSHGLKQDKTRVKDLIRNILGSYLPIEDDVLNVYDFHSVFLDPMIKWEVIMYILKKKYKEDAFEHFVRDNSLAEPKHDIEDGVYENYAITVDDIDNAYLLVVDHTLSYEEMLDVLATLVYIRIKGQGCVDTLLEMNIDGINIGVSGSIVTDLIHPGKIKDTAPRSVWVNYHGIYIHLRYLTFNTIDELRRVVMLLCRYNNPGALTEKRGYLINTMWDQSRILAFRPNAGETWAAFVRKFSLGDIQLEQLINPMNLDNSPRYGNTQLAYNAVKYIMMCLVTAAFTGRQGSGKTTMMVRAIKYIDPKYNIRLLETAPEMYLREMYPLRNIYSVAETPWVSTEELQDALKKSDAAITFVGEVATNILAARMMQSLQIASLATYFSHHGNDTDGLVTGLTNSVVAASHGAATPATAMQQIVDGVHVNIHLDYDVRQNRFIDYIEEIVPLQNKPYPTYNKADPVNSMNNITREYYVRSTDRKVYEVRRILHFDKKTMSYVADHHFFTKSLTEYMVQKCPSQFLGEFKNFVTSNWRKKNG